MTSPQDAIVVGAGFGGLAAALDLAASGHRVTLLETADAVGGKARRVAVGGRAVDAGPTVFTMRWVLDALLARVGARLEDHLALERAELLARHGWGDGSRLDLFADPARSEAAIAEFAGGEEARRFRAFSERAGRVYRALAPHFIEAAKPTPLGIARAIGPDLRLLRDLAPAQSLAGLLAQSFRDPRLRQLFGRYATYVGGSPYAAPALLMLIWHVEAAGVWRIEGGIAALAALLARLAEERGAVIRTGAEVAEILVEGGRAHGVRLTSGERLAARAVVFAGDVSALGEGRLGPAAARAAASVPRTQRALSALTVTGLARAPAALAHHTVVFSGDYEAEFDRLLRARRLPIEPTVYVCAQDRPAHAAPTAPSAPSAAGAPTAPAAPEPVLLIINAPPDGDLRRFSPEEIDTCLTGAHRLLARAGFPLETTPTDTRLTGPADWAARFPGSGGAIYGRAPHGPGRGALASFQRPGARSRLPGLYLAGGSVHPGAGVPMATLSGRQAAAAVTADLEPPRARASMSRSRPAATPGGISTASPTTAATPSPSSPSSAASSPRITPGAGASGRRTTAR